MKLIRNNTYNHDIIYTSGLSGSGKTLIARILGCYDGVEKQLEDEIVNIINELHWFNKISEETAIYFLRTVIDRRIYNHMLCRRINFRWLDTSSIFHYPYPLDYFKRIFLYEKHREDINEFISSKNPAFNNMMQNGLTHMKLHLKAFDKRIKLIYILRNPMEVIYGINQRGFMNRMGKNPTNTLITLKYKDNLIPAQMMDWKNEYSDLNPLDKAILWVYFLIKSDFDSYEKLPEYRKKQVIFIKFDEFVTNPFPICMDIEDFIGRKMTWKIKHFLKREECPRRLDYKDRIKKGKYIRKHMDKESIDELEGLIYRYNRWIEKY